MENTPQDQTISQLFAEIATLKNEIARLKTAQTTDQQIVVAAAKPSRRKLLKQLALATAGVAAAGAAIGSATQNAAADATGTVSGASTAQFGLSAAPTGVTPPTPAPSATGVFGLIGATDATATGPGPADIRPGLTPAATFGLSAGVLGASSAGVGGRFRGGLANLYLDPATTDGPPTSGTHYIGELYGDRRGWLYYCIRSGQAFPRGQVPTNFTGRLARWAVVATDRSVYMHYFDAPVRVKIVLGTDANALTAQGNPPTSGTIVRVTGVADVAGLNTLEQVPVGARGVLGTLTNIGSTATGNLRLWPTDGIIPGTINLNIFGIPGANGLVIPNNSTHFQCRLNDSETAGKDGTLSIAYSSGTTGATTGFAIDIIGYHL